MRRFGRCRWGWRYDPDFTYCFTGLGPGVTTLLSIASSPKSWPGMHADVQLFARHIDLAMVLVHDNLSRIRVTSPSERAPAFKAAITCREAIHMQVLVSKAAALHTSTTPHQQILQQFHAMSVITRPSLALLQHRVVCCNEACCGMM